MTTLNLLVLAGHLILFGTCPKQGVFETPPRCRSFLPRLGAPTDEYEKGQYVDKATGNYHCTPPTLQACPSGKHSNNKRRETEIHGFCYILIFRPVFYCPVLPYLRWQMDDRPGSQETALQAFANPKRSSSSGRQMGDIGSPKSKRGSYNYRQVTSRE